MGKQHKPLHKSFTTSSCNRFPIFETSSNCIKRIIIIAYDRLNICEKNFGSRPRPSHSTCHSGLAYLALARNEADDRLMRCDRKYVDTSLSQDLPTLSLLCRHGGAIGGVTAPDRIPITSAQVVQGGVSWLFEAYRMFDNSSCT